MAAGARLKPDRSSDNKKGHHPYRMMAPVRRSLTRLPSSSRVVSPEHDDTDPDPDEGDDGDGDDGQHGHEMSYYTA
jgi:hypothetical protein